MDRLGRAPLAPRTLFESHFRSADVLLKVYRLLEATEVNEQGLMIDQVRTVLAANHDEPMLFFLNDVFVGVVRERAQLPRSFFRSQNMAMLLRQAVVAACTSLDVYFPALLESHLPTMVRVKGRNFVPNDKEVIGFFKNFSISLEDHLRVLEEPSTQYEQLASLILKHLGDRVVMANGAGVAVALKLLDIPKPWDDLSAHLGRSPGELPKLIDTLTKRRNDIVHRGDRMTGGSDHSLKEIDYSWANLHIRAAESVVLACDELVTRRMREFDDVLSAAD